MSGKYHIPCHSSGSSLPMSFYSHSVAMSCCDNRDCQGEAPLLHITKQLDFANSLRLIHSHMATCHDSLKLTMEHRGGDHIPEHTSDNNDVGKKLPSYRESNSSISKPTLATLTLSFRAGGNPASSLVPYGSPPSRG